MHKACLEVHFFAFDRRKSLLANRFQPATPIPSPFLGKRKGAKGNQALSGAFPCRVGVQATH